MKYFSHLFAVPACACLLCGALATAAPEEQAAAKESVTASEKAKPWQSDADWVLVFEDNFSGKKLNTKKWRRIVYEDYPENPPQWLQHQSEAADLMAFGKHDGEKAMKLFARYGKYTTMKNKKKAEETFACSGVTTRPTFAFNFGYVEIRAKMDGVQGTWPALWMLPKKGKGWPAGGEIDILEHLNKDTIAYQTMHYHGSQNNYLHPSFQPRMTLEDWHTYAVEWTEDEVIFYLDGKESGRVKNNSSNWPFGKGMDFYLLVDQQVCGGWVEGSGKADKEYMSKKPAGFYIDYVRVYSDKRFMHSSMKGAKDSKAKDGSKDVKKPAKKKKSKPATAAL